MGRKKIIECSMEEYRKEYYEKNKESLLSKYSEKEICNLCGRQYSKYNKSKHVNSNYHKNLEYKLNEKIEKIKYNILVGIYKN
jgi:hypothetical protein